MDNLLVILLCNTRQYVFLPHSFLVGSSSSFFLSDKFMWNILCVSILGERYKYNLVSSFLFLPPSLIEEGRKDSQSDWDVKWNRRRGKKERVGKNDPFLRIIAYQNVTYWWEIILRLVPFCSILELTLIDGRRIREYFSSIRMLKLKSFA